MSHCYRWTIWTRVSLCALSGCHLRTVVRVAAITVLLGAGVSLRPAHAQTFPDFPVNIPTGPNDFFLDANDVSFPGGVNNTIVNSEFRIDVQSFSGNTPVLPDGSILFIPDTTPNTTFNGQQVEPGNIFADVFHIDDVSVWSRTTGNDNLTGDSDQLVLPFTVTTTGMMTLREPLVIPVVAPTLPQWGLVLLTLVLLTLATRRITKRRGVV